MNYGKAIKKINFLRVFPDWKCIKETIDCTIKNTA